MLDFLSQVMNLFDIPTRNKTRYLKRKLYKNPTFLSAKKYHKYVFWACIIDIIMMALIYFVVSTVNLVHGGRSWTIISLLKFWVIILLLIIVLMLFVIVTYHLLVYPRSYLKNQQPICYYTDDNQMKSGIVLDLFKDNVLVSELKSNNQISEYLRLISLKQVKYIKKRHEVNKSGLRNDLRTIKHTVERLWNKLIHKIVKPFYSKSLAKYRKVSRKAKQENSKLKREVKMLKDKR